jgi:hypothetical protein
VKVGVGKDQKKLGKKRACVLCTSRKVETEKHFILECEVFKDNGDNYINILTASSWNDSFSEGTVEKLGDLIIKLNMKIVESLKSVCEAVCPIG